MYPNYKALLPASCATTVKIDVAALTSALKRVSTVAQANSAVKFDISAETGQMMLSAISNDQDAATATVEVEAEGASGVIAFNYHYIFGCLNSALPRERDYARAAELQPPACSSPTTRSTTSTWSCRFASSRP